MKALIAARDDHIIGFTMIGSEADEVVAVVQTAISRACHIRHCSNVPPPLS